MNLETNHSKKDKNLPVEDFIMDEIDFKPITSGLGFHHSKIQDVKPVFTEKTIATPVLTPMNSPNLNRAESPVYQNDLSLFYNNSQNPSIPVVPLKTGQPEDKVETYYSEASRGQRVMAYFLDLTLIGSLLSIVLIVMARTISMDLLEVWTNYPNEITPLFIILFSGFYLIYFSVFEKGLSSTFGKNMLGLRVVNLNNSSQTMGMLTLRSVITLFNFLTFGLFSWFDLQNKVTHSKVIRAK
jgi:uncharacterized RDD family membrane protein YckC